MPRMSATSKNRWLRWSLRTLFVAVAISATVLYLCGASIYAWLNPPPPLPTPWYNDGPVNPPGEGGYNEPS